MQFTRAWKRAVHILLTVSLWPALTSADLVGHYTFDENSGYGVKGTFAPGASIIVDAEKGRVLSLDGSGSVNLGNDSYFDIENEITLSAWIKVKDFTSDFQAIITKGDSSWRLARSYNRNVINFACTGVNMEGTKWGDIRGYTEVNDGQWHHLAGVYDGKTMYLYVDGNLDNSTKASGLIASNDYEVLLGENAEQKGRGYVGLIDDVVIRNHALAGDEIAQLYELDRRRMRYESETRELEEAAEQAELLIGSGSFQSATELLQQQITQNKKWVAASRKGPALLGRQRYFDLLYLLAKCQQLAGSSDEEVAVLYKHALSGPPSWSNTAEALLWFHRNRAEDEYALILRKFVTSQYLQPKTLFHLAGAYRSDDRNWGAFQILLDLTFAKAKRVGPIHEAVMTSLANHKSWAVQYARYSEANSGVIEYLDDIRVRKMKQLARKAMSLENYQRACDLYRELVAHGALQDTAAVEYKICECLLKSEAFDQAIHELARFIENRKTTHRALVIEALMMKGVILVNLGDLDQAMETFLTVLIEYPESPRASGASYYIGYCSMLQGDYNQAAHAFQTVTLNYPRSDFTTRSHEYIARMKAMLE